MVRELTSPGTPELPLPMSDVYLSMMRSAAVVHAARLGVFKLLENGALDVTEAATRLQCHERGMRSLLDALVAFGYLRLEDGRYANSAFVEAYFTSKGTVDFTPGLLWTAEAWRMLEDLDGAVQRGGPRVSMWEEMKQRPATAALFSRYMEAYAAYIVPDVQDAVSLPRDARRMLDVGGSHGLHSVAFCTRYPELHATVFDLRESLANTADVAARHGLSDRISTRAGNSLVDDLGTGYDVVLLFSVMHNHTPQENRALLTRLASALKPGGLLVIHDYLRPATPQPHLSALALTLMLEVGATIHGEEDVRDWLSVAGFHDVNRKELHPQEKGTMLLATRR
ncbi:MAG: methyltransferase [Myxococcota bacterium]